MMPIERHYFEFPNDYPYRRKQTEPELSEKELEYPSTSTVATTGWATASYSVSWLHHSDCLIWNPVLIIVSIIWRHVNPLCYLLLDSSTILAIHPLGEATPQICLTHFFDNALYLTDSFSGAITGHDSSISAMNIWSIQSTWSGGARVWYCPAETRTPFYCWKEEEIVDDEQAFSSQSFFLLETLSSTLELLDFAISCQNQLRHIHAFPSDCDMFLWAGPL